MLSGIQLVLAGMFVGVLVAVPIGPVNVLCIQRTVERGFWGGLAAGLGAVLGDGVLAAVAAFSVTAISDLMIAYAGPIELIGGALLIAFGSALLFGKRLTTIEPEQESDFWQHCGITPHTFFLTITNPGAILGMLALIGGLSSFIGGLNNYLEALVLVGAVMGGSLLWWVTLSEVIATIRHKLNESRLRLINRAAGTVLFVFGVVLIVDAVLRQVR